MPTPQELQKIFAQTRDYLAERYGLEKQEDPSIWGKWFGYTASLLNVGYDAVQRILSGRPLYENGFWREVATQANAIGSHFDKLSVPSKLLQSLMVGVQGIAPATMTTLNGILGAVDKTVSSAIRGFRFAGIYLPQSLWNYGSYLLTGDKFYLKNQAELERSLLEEDEKWNRIQQNAHLSGMALTWLMVSDDLHKAFGIEHAGDRWIIYKTPEGQIQRKAVHWGLVSDELEKLHQQGAEVIDIQADPDSAEMAETVIMNIGNLTDPAQWVIGGAVAKPIGKFFGMMRSGMGGVISAGIRPLAQTAVGENIVRGITKLEGSIGSALTKTSLSFHRIFAPQSRVYESRIELTKRFVDNIDRYVTTGEGDLAKMIETTPERTAELLGENALSVLVSYREAFQRKVQDLMDAGLSHTEAVAKATEEYKKAQATTQFLQTGIPTDPEILEFLKRKDITVAEAKAKIEEWGKKSFSSTEADALEYLLKTGEIENVDLTPEFLLSLPEEYRVPVANVLVGRQKPMFSAVQDVINATDPEAIAHGNGIEIDYKVAKFIDNVLPKYRKDVRQRVAYALSALLHTDDPAERQAIVDYTLLYLTERGYSPAPLLRRIRKFHPEEGEAGFKESLLRDLHDTVYALRNDADEAQRIRQRIDDYLKNIPDEEAQRIQRLDDILRRLEAENLKPKAMIIQCSGEALQVAGMADAMLPKTEAQKADMIRYVAEQGEDATVSPLYAYEQEIRRQAMRDLAEQGRTVDDITDPLVKSWLLGETSATLPTATKSEVADGMRLVSSMVNDMGIDREFLAHSMDLYENAIHSIIRIVDVVGQHEGISIAEAQRLLRFPQQLSQAIDEVERFLENNGHIEDAHRVAHLKDKIDQYQLWEQILNGEIMDSDAHALVKNYISPIGMLYWKGKEFAIQDGFQLMTQLLLDASKQAGVEFVSETPTLIHSHRLDGISKALDGMFTTPYIASILQSFKEGGAGGTVWKGWLDVMNTIMKLSSVVWNPLAILRDFVSNTSALLFGLEFTPHEWYKIGLYYRKAFHSIRNRDEAFLRMAQETPSVWGASAQFGTVENETIRRFSGFSTQRWLWYLTNLPVLKHMQALRGWSEALGKMAMFHAVEDLLKQSGNKGIENLAKFFNLPKEAVSAGTNTLPVLVAEKYMLDYHDVPPLIQFLRRYLGLFPFITYEAKMASLLINDIPHKLNSVYYVLSAIQRGQQVIDPTLHEDYEDAIRRILPQRIAENPLSFVWYDKSTNRVKALDLSFYMPFGVLMPYQRIFNSGLDINEVITQVKQRMGGFLVPLMEVTINRDFYTGKPLFNPDAPPYEKTKGIVTHIAKAIAPIIPRSLIDYIASQTAEEKEKLTGRIDWNEDPAGKFFSIYQIDLDEAVAYDTQNTMKRANTYLNKAYTEYFRLISEGRPNLAKQAFTHYMQLANHLRIEAMDRVEHAFRLKGADELGIGDWWKDPNIGYNPQRDYRRDIIFLQWVFDMMVANDLLPQQTTKEDVMWRLIDTADALLRILLAKSEQIALSRRQIEENITDLNERLANRQTAQLRSGVTIPFPLPSVTPTEPITENDIAPILQALFDNTPTFTMGMQTAKQTGTVTQNVAKGYVSTINQLLSQQPTLTPPSLGGKIKQQKGRPTGGVIE